MFRQGLRLGPLERIPDPHILTRGFGAVKYYARDCSVFCARDRGWPRE